MPAAAARSTASRTRSSASRRGPAYSAAAGTLARSASSTAFRPATTSAASPPPRRSAGIFAAERPPPPGPVPPPAGFRASSPGPGCPASLAPPRAVAARAAAPARRCAGWPGRRCAGGVGPLPSSRFRPLPPVPTRGLPDFARPPPPDGVPPLTVPPSRTRSWGAARPWAGSSLDGPSGAVRGVLDQDAGRVQPPPDRVRSLVVLAVLGRLPLVERHRRQRTHDTA